jgi:hypothetical protein
MESNSKTYLGDGAYAEYDGYGIKLTTEDGISVQNTIYMEPSLITALINFVKRIENGEVEPSR